MRGVSGLYGTSVGKKIFMALTGGILVAFLIGHMVGNLKVFQGPEAFNHYAEGLRVFGSPFLGKGQLLWLVRLALLASVVVHIVAVVQLYRRSAAARTHRYGRYRSLAFSFTSRTMLWGGITILAFVIYHLMHMTIGNAHPDFIHGDAYHNFVAGFRVWPVTLGYLAAMVPLGFHIYHGTWSALQTLGANNPTYNRFRRPVAVGLAVAIVAGFAAGPLAVVIGIVD